MNFKKIAALLMVGVMTFSMVACGSDDDDSTSDDNGSVAEEQDADEEEDEEEEEDSSAAEGTIVITGSTSVESIVEDYITEFEALNPGVTVQYSGTGSSAGMTDTQEGTNNIGALSREVKDEEEDGEIQQVVFAYDGIAVIVNPNNEAAADLPLDDLRQIYNGTITDWSEVGGDAGEILVVSREESSGTRSAFEELIGFDSEEGDALPNEAQVVEGNGNVQASIESNDAAIGYVSFSYLDDSVKALTVEGVEATADNAKAGDYPLSRPFIFVYYEENVTDAGKDFLDFALSAEGQDIVEENGGITID